MTSLSSRLPATERSIKLQICRYFKLAPNAPKTRRPQARGIARREEILDAATRLFARQGSRGTGILALAEEVGISHVGVLHHFGTKEGLLLAVAERRDRHQAARLAHLADLRGLKALRAVQELGEGELLDLLHARLFVVLIAENLQPRDPLNAYFRTRSGEVRRFVADAVSTGQDDGEIRPDADPDAIAIEVVGFIAGISVQWVLHPEAVDLAGGYRQYVERLIDHLSARAA
jgi:AcrR family transcriptional regulator